jgi:hypothetical protein
MFARAETALQFIELIEKAIDGVKWQVFMNESLTLGGAWKAIHRRGTENTEVAQEVSGNLSANASA